MQPDKPKTSTAADRWCNAWACICIGFVAGFGACAMMQERGFAVSPVQFTFQAMVFPLSFLAMALPRGVLEIARLIRRYRRTAA